MIAVHKYLNKVSFIFIFCWLLLLASHAQNVQLEVLNSAQGLSQGMIYDILQDRNGFIWFGTRGGLNRYDGYTFKVLKNDPFDPFSISDNTVQALLEDKTGRIWIGTENNGLDVYEPRSGKFFHLKAGPRGLSHGRVAALTEAPDGTIWVATRNGLTSVKIPNFWPKDSASLRGIARVEQFFWEAPAQNAPEANVYESVICADDGTLWVGSLRRAYRFNTKTRKKIILPTLEPHRFPSPTETNYFAKGPDGAVWLGQGNRVIRFRGEKMDIFPFPETANQYTTYLAFDQQGNLYIGRRKQVFRFARHDLEKNTPVQPQIFCAFTEVGVMGSTKIHCDRNGLIWIGTNGYGVRKYNLVNQFFQHFLPGISTRRLCPDRNGRLWIWDNHSNIRLVDEPQNQLAEPFIPDKSLFHHDLLHARDGSFWFLGEKRTAPSEGGVLIRKNEKTGATQQFRTPILIGMFSQLMEDQHGDIWVYGRESQLTRLDLSSNKFSSYDFSQYTGAKEIGHALMEDANGHYWIGTPHGLLRGILNKANKMDFTLFKNDPTNREGLNNNFILSVHDDPRNPKQYLWVGTKGGGLNLLDKKTGNCQHFTMKNGLPDDVVYGILSDSRGHLWLSTNSGLSKFTPENKHFENYSVADGLQDNEFNTISFAKGFDDRLFFGGVNGITAFVPEKIAPNAQPPKVFITGLKVNNKQIAAGEEILSKNIEYTQSLSLKYTQNHITLDFAAMDFASASKNQFRYRLKGADKNWIESTTAHTANYSNLLPGKYLFEVSSGGAHGVWPAEPVAQLSIYIRPPWWRTTFAYLCYGLALLVGLWQLNRWQKQRIRLQQQRLFEQKEIERIRELEQLKTNFFANITHELRTPITLIIEPLRQILSNPKAENWLSKIQIAERSGSKLLYLVTQLLDLAKIEGGAMHPEFQWGSIDDTLQAVADSFADQARRKGITFYSGPVQQVLGMGYFDADKLGKIAANLLSNALKFTPEEGTVSLTWSQELEGHKQFLVMEVRDTGPGIAPESIAHIFDRFYTIYSVVDGQAGTGIGLALCKELAEIMQGQITVESKLGQGALFRLKIPLELASSYHQLPPPEPLVAVEQTLPIFEAETNPNAQISVLVVEDNAELRAFLTQTLAQKYLVSNAENGEIAFAMAQEQVPDVVVTDLMMPQVDGMELLQLLKNNLTTSHIPVLMLTARTALETRLESIKFGADAYLQKPFNTLELMAWVDNLLENRRLLQQRITKEKKQKFATLADHSTEAVATLSALDQDFLARLQQALTLELENEDLNVEDLARLMFISRSQLHRKLNALTGLSSSEFIRNFRLDQAMLMLKTERGKISDVATRVGFRNVKYFSTAFKEYFGVSPSEI